MTSARRAALGAVLGSLSNAGLDLDAIDVADALWLAAALPPPAPSAPAPTPASVGAEPTVDATPSDLPAPENRDNAPAAPPALGAQPGPTRHLYAKGDVSAAAGAPALRLPDASALAQKLALGRALKPLKRRVRGRSRVVLDEEKTATRAATLRLSWPDHPLVPSFHFALERWLDAVLVVDRSQTMAIWRRQLEELEALLHRSGAFRSLRVWHLIPGTNGPLGTNGLRLASPTGALDDDGWMARSDAELRRDRRLVLVASDCIGAHWRSGAMGAWLREHASTGPVAILSPLAQHQWERTALGDFEPFLLRAHASGGFLPRLDATRIERDHDADDDTSDAPAGPTTAPIPVVPLDPRRVGAWARMLVGHPSGSATAHVFSLDATAPATSQVSARAVDGAALVDRFLRSSSAPTRRLAIHLSALPLMMPVLRIVRAELVKDATDAHLTELLWSGLLERKVPDLWRADVDDVVFDFKDGVRARLLEALGRTQTDSIVKRIGAFVASRRSDGYDFSAIAVDSTAELTPSQRPFASVMSALAALERHVPPAAPPVVDPVAVADNPRAPEPAPSAPPEVVAPPAYEAIAPQPLNGHWVFVDGDDLGEDPAPWRAIAAGLARHGFSMVGRASNRAAEGVARAYAEIDGRPIDFTQRIVWIGDSAPPSAPGRLLAARDEDVLHAAALRADTMIAVRSSAFAAGFDAAVERARPRRRHVPLALTFDPGRAERFQSDLLVRASSLPQESALPELGPALLVAEAMIARESVDVFAARPEVSGVPAVPALVVDLLTDGRPSRRFLGLGVAMRLPREVLSVPAITPSRAQKLAKWLRVEQRSLRLFEERAVLRGLAPLLDGKVLSGAGSVAWALGVVVGYLEPDLGELSEVMRAAAQARPDLARGLALAALAREYVALRASTPAGGGRTAMMNGLVSQMSGVSPPPHDPFVEALVWFELGDEGTRVVALAILLMHPSTASAEILADAVQRSRSAFEQYIALRAIDAVGDGFSESDRRRLWVALGAARSPTGQLDSSDRSRWDLSEILVERLRAPGENEPPPSSGPESSEPPEARAFSLLHQARLGQGAGATEPPSWGLLAEVLGMVRSGKVSVTHLATTLQELASRLVDEGRTDEAEALLRQAVTLEEDGNAPPVARAVTLCELARLLSTRKWEEAERLFRQAVDLQQESTSQVTRASTLRSLAIGLAEHDRWGEAAPLFELAVELETVGDASPTTRATTLVAYARALVGAPVEDVWPRAESLFQRALDLQKTSSAKEPLAKTLAAFVDALKGRRRAKARLWRDAEPLYREVIALQEQTGAPLEARAIVLDATAHALLEEGRTEEGTAMLKQAVDLATEAETRGALVRELEQRGGYDRQFLGVTLKLPVVAADDLLSFVDSAGKVRHELRYEHFSVLMSATRRMCRVFAGNIDRSVDADLESLRPTEWHVDPRIPDAAQLDVPHGAPASPAMFRANYVWGSPEARARARADLFAMPSVVPIEATPPALWHEIGEFLRPRTRASRRCTFGGPIFRPDDPAVAGVHTPVGYWSVIAFLHDLTLPLEHPFFERSKCPWELPLAAKLRDALCDLYPAWEDARAVVLSAGLEPDPSSWHTRAAAWTSILDLAAKMGATRRLLERVRADRGEGDVVRRILDASPADVIGDQLMVFAFSREWHVDGRVSTVHQRPIEWIEKNAGIDFGGLADPLPSGSEGVVLRRVEDIVGLP